MKYPNAVKLFALGALTGSLLGPAIVQNATAQPEQGVSAYPSLTGESADIQKAAGDATPGAAASHINDYRHQEEQINLDANAGNVRVLRTDQKALVNDFVTATFPVKKVNARELRNVFRVVLGLEGGRAEVIKDKDGNEQLIQVICPSFQLAYLKKAIPALDEEWVREYDTGSGDIYYKAQHRGAAAIDFIASNYASDSGFSSVDATNNAVSRIDEPFRTDHYLEGAKLVDIPANQVTLDVTVYEVSANNDVKLGLDYVNWKNGPGRNLANFVFQDLTGKTHSKGASSPFDVFGDAAATGATHNQYYQYYAAANYLLTSNFVDFLNVSGKARVMTKQTLTVKSANTASLTAEDVVVALVAQPGDSSTVSADSQPGIAPSIVRPRAVSGGGTVSAAVADSSRRLHNAPAGSTGLFLSLTPFVGLESMELVVSASDADMNGLAPNGQPIINTRNVATTVRLVDGEPYVVSGLKRSHDIRETAKAPWLGDIPGLGYFFGGENTVNRIDDVLIVIKPTFTLASQATMEAPASINVKDLVKVVVDKAPRAVPADKYGFDQWLLDQ